MKLNAIINELMKKEKIIIESDDMDYTINQIIDMLKKEKERNNFY